jgi:anti-sigma B factor antagonist
VEGDLTIYTVAAVTADLFARLAQPAVLTELDLGAVPEIDTAGVQLLMMARRAASRAGASVRLVNTPPQVTRTLELLGLDEEMR